MLKKLLKYEFKATARTYGGMYLALLAASVLFGGSVRRWNGTNSDTYSTLVGLLSLVYTAVIVGTVVNYVVGVAMFVVVAHSAIAVGITACVLPFIPTAIIKAVLACAIGLNLRKRIPWLKA